MFEKLKKEKKMKDLVVEKINEEIEQKINAPGTDAREVFELWEKKQAVRMNGLRMSDAAKIAANVIIVGVIIGFEMSHVMNKTATKFIKPL